MKLGHARSQALLSKLSRSLCHPPLVIRMSVVERSGKRVRADSRLGK